jgi:hypothetical protein
VAILFAVFATAFFLAPTKLIKRVSLVKTPVSAASNTGKVGHRALALEFEMKHPLPILQRLPLVGKTGGGVVKAEVGTVFIDRDVRAGENLSFYSVPANLAQAWTAHYFTASPPQPRSILSLLRGFNSSLVNAWPTLRQDVRRMFMREGFAYVRIPDHGNWKMDLHGCEILEEGQALEKVVKVDAAGVDRSWWSTLMDWLGTTDSKSKATENRKGFRAGMARAVQAGSENAYKTVEKRQRKKHGEMAWKRFEER